MPYAQRHAGVQGVQGEEEREGGAIPAEPGKPMELFSFEELGNTPAPDDES